MPDEKEPVDIQKVIEQGTKRRPLSELQKEGHETVKVLDEQALQELIRLAVNEVVSTAQRGEATRIISAARKQLDQLLKKAKGWQSHAQLLEANKNDLVLQVEDLRKQLHVQQQVEKAMAAAEEELKDLRAQLAQEQKRASEAEAGVQALALLQERFDAGQQDLKKLKSETIKLSKEQSRTQKDVEQELQKSKEQLARANSELEKIRDQLAHEQQKARTAAHGSVRALAELEKMHDQTNRYQQDTKVLRAAEKEIAQAAKDSERAREALQARVKDLESQLQRAEHETKDARTIGREQIAKLQEDHAKASKDAAQRLDTAEKAAAAHTRARKELESRLLRATGESKDLRAGLDSANESLARRRRKSQKVSGLEKRLHALEAQHATDEKKLSALRKDASAAKKSAAEASRLEASLARERSKSRRANEQLALPGRIDKAVASLRAKLIEAHKISERASEESKSVEAAMARLGRSLPKKR